MLFKKSTIYIVMAVLCLFSKAQAQQAKAIDETSKGLQIGQKVPDVLISNLYNYKDKDGKPASTAKLSDFEGKLLIIDFWATWCSPCLAMIPKMDSLQKAYNEKVQFLSVTYQTSKEVLPFLSNFEKQRNKHYDLPIVTDSKALHVLFPHKVLPHYVWIDQNGVVQAITGMEEITDAKIKSALAGGYNVAKKKDIFREYDASQPLFINSNGGTTNNLIYHTMLTGYTPGLIASSSSRNLKNINGKRLVFTNVSLPYLLDYAYGEGNPFLKNRIIINVKDSSSLLSKSSTLPPLEWAKKYQYNYEIIVPPHMEHEIYKLMQADLLRLFPQYNIRIKQVQQKCAVLERTSNIDKISYKGGELVSQFNTTGFKLNGYYIGSLIGQLKFIYLQKSEYPIIDNTGYLTPVTMSGSANLTNITSINELLETYDLKFNIKDQMIDVLVIEDKKSN